MEVSKGYYNKIDLELDKLIIYRDILEDDVVSKVKELAHELSLDVMDINKISRLYHEYAYALLKESQKLGLKGDLHKEYVINLIVRSKNFFSLECERNGLNIDRSLYNLALNDIIVLQNLLNMDFKEIRDLLDISTDLEINNSKGDDSYLCEFKNAEREILNAEDPEEFEDRVINYYNSVGCGELAKFIAFRWSKESGLVGVENYDSIQMEDIIGYEYQKKVLSENTEAFLKGNPANNVLLVGARGTGKSSSIKALLNKYYKNGLRLLEITKEQLLYLPDVINEVKKRGKYFIFFIDDLSFEDGEREYKQMKSILDGGIEKTPKNVLIYATSNRRHLIRETWSDKTEELHEGDTANEKLSLSDRFGITLTYTAPNQDEYLAIVESIAKKHNINLPSEVVRQEAIKWELSQNGRSGRTAKQFVKHLINLTKQN